jgi:hypothetical protein
MFFQIEFRAKGKTRKLYMPIALQNSVTLFPLLLERVRVRRYKKPNFDVQTLYTVSLLSFAC